MMKRSDGDDIDYIIIIEIGQGESEVMNFDRRCVEFMSINLIHRGIAYIKILYN